MNTWCFDWRNVTITYTLLSPPTHTTVTDGITRGEVLLYGFCSLLNLNHAWGASSNQSTKINKAYDQHPFYIIYPMRWLISLVLPNSLAPKHQPIPESRSSQKCPHAFRFNYTQTVRPCWWHGPPRSHVWNGRWINGRVRSGEANNGYLVREKKWVYDLTNVGRSF